MRPLAFELAVQDAAGVRVAAEAGADRVELCAALRATGGVTPSRGIIEAAVAVGLPTYVLVRCRPGPFVYDADEIAVMARDAALAVGAGAAGVVIGTLTASGDVDRDAVGRLRDAARGVDPGCDVCFHRAMDVAIGAGRGPAVLDALIDLGLTRVLTSGGAVRSLDGAPVLKELVARADGCLEIMAGGGVTPSDVPALATTGVAAVHLSAMASVRTGFATGPGGGADSDIHVTDPRIAKDVARAVGAVNAARGSPQGRTRHSSRRRE